MRKYLMSEAAQAEVLYDRLKLGRKDAEAVLTMNLIEASSAEVGAKGIIQKEAGERVRPLRRIVRRHEQSVDLIFDPLRRPSRPRRNHRFRKGHRFEEDQSKSLSRAR